jgi:hypothetical protein
VKLSLETLLLKTPSTMSTKNTPKRTPRRRTPKKSASKGNNGMTPKSLNLERASTTKQFSPSTQNINNTSTTITPTTTKPNTITATTTVVQKENLHTTIAPIPLKIQNNLNSVYKLFRRRCGKLGGGGAGGAIYGEVTQKSFARIVDLLKSKCELDTTSTFIDIGAGLGKPNLHVALDPGVKASVGVELGGERWWQSQDILWHGLEEKTAKETGLDALNGPVFLAHADFLEVDSLNAFSHVYMFDKGFPPVLMQHIADVFNASKTSKYLMCFKKPKTIVDAYEFNVEEIGRVRTSMSGSGEGNTCFFYRKLGQTNATNKSSSSKSTAFSWQVPLPPTDASVAPPVDHCVEYGQKGMECATIASTGSLTEYRDWLKQQVGFERSTGRRLRSRTKKK